MKDLRWISVLLLGCLAATAAAQPVQWEFSAPMTTPRAGLAATALDGQIYVLGGQDRLGNVLDLAARYDPKGDRWEVLPPLRKARVNAAAVTFQGQVFVLGGRDREGEALEDVEFFDPFENRWRSFDGMEEKREGLTAAIRNGKIYVAGGSNEQEQILESIEFYDPGEQKWIEFDGANDNPDDDDDDDETGPGEVEFCESEIDLNTGDTFNIRDYVRLKDDPAASIDWAQVFFTYTDAGANDPTNPPDWNLAAFNGGQTATVTAADAAPGTGNRDDGSYRVYVARLGRPQFDDHLTFRIDDDRQSEAASARCSQGGGHAARKRTDGGKLGVPRASFAAVQVGDSVLFLGGFSRFGPLDLVQRLLPDGSFDFLAPLPASRGGLAATAIADTLYAIGGRDAGNQVLGGALMLVPGSAQWRSLPPLNDAREGAAAVAVGGVVYVFGGRNAGGKVLDSVEAFGALRTASQQPLAPPDFRLAQNYPNPFRAGTTVTFSVSAQAAGRPVLLTVFDVQGRRVATLVDGVLPPGEHHVRWDGTGRDGRPLGSGVYVYRLRQGALVAHNLMAIVH